MLVSLFLLLVCTGSGDTIARVFDSKSGNVRRAFKGHVLMVTSLQVRVIGREDTI